MSLIERQRDMARREQWESRWMLEVPPMFRDAHRVTPVQATYRDLLNGFHAGQPSGLVLTGPVGTGKTHQGYAILNTLVEYGIVHPSRILAGRESLILTESVYGVWSARGDARSKLTNPQLKVVLVDDAGHATWRNQQDRWSVWTDLTDHLLSHAGFLIITTNLSAPDLAAWVGEPAAHRLKALARGARVVNDLDYRSQKFPPFTPTQADTSNLTENFGGASGHGGKAH